LKKTVKSIIAGVICLIIPVFAGCGIDGEPRPRMGSYPASSLPTKFLDINSLGSHSYGNGMFENNGLVYTSRGGHIDIAHLRIAADNTRSLYNKVRTHLLNNDSEFTYKLNVEPSNYHVEMKYPEWWANLPEKYKVKIADKVSLELSQHFTYTMTTWHEVLTWFGFKCLFFLPEKASAFSWEDIYSNLLGTRLGAMAMKDKEHSFDEAMTILLKRELEELGIQPSGMARRAAREMKKKYFDGQSYFDITRNFDIGLDDGMVTPFIYATDKEAKAKSYPIPTMEIFNTYGFAMTLEIEPREFESGKILKIIYPAGGGKSVLPGKHLPIVMRYVENDAKKQGFAVIPSGKPELIVSAK